ncbi:biopolymer transport protein ExbD [Fluviicoccus keumensis]|uniref:Biopolymer transport protein ExbD n=1 Tax=Fluviicoccus keumensis TaxID=1435465 RepID=A0A4V2G5I7_9GAMM|nr:biopolymer transporter ExbD [Fluviicoccus keumensis]RZU45026.1 biopolymer transport protein ExbD [Fluviicoccus keumensis]
MKFRRPREDSLEINLTPLIDCLLFLIIFLMISTTFNKASKLQIVLPEAKGEASKAPRAKALEIGVSQSGVYTVNGQELAVRDPRQLQSAIEKASGGRRDMPFVIAADGKASHQSVVTVMDIAGQMGFVNLNISTKMRSENP